MSAREGRARWCIPYPYLSPRTHTKHMVVHNWCISLPLLYSIPSLRHLWLMTAIKTWSIDFYFFLHAPYTHSDWSENVHTLAQNIERRTFKFLQKWPRFSSAASSERSSGQNVGPVRYSTIGNGASNQWFKMYAWLRATLSRVYKGNSRRGSGGDVFREWCLGNDNNNMLLLFKWSLPKLPLVNSPFFSLEWPPWAKTCILLLTVLIGLAVWTQFWFHCSNISGGIIGACLFAIMCIIAFLCESTHHHQPSEAAKSIDNI